MKKLSNFEFDRTAAATQYDWDRLFDGSPWLVAFEDMNWKPSDEPADRRARFRRTAYAAAKSRGVKLTTQSHDDGLVIQVTGTALDDTIT